MTEKAITKEQLQDYMNHVMEQKTAPGLLFISEGQIQRYLEAGIDLRNDPNVVIVPSKDEK